MMKFLIMLVMMLVLIYLRGGIFLNSLLFLMLIFLFLQTYERGGVEVLIGLFTGMNEYSFFMVCLSVWIFGLIFMALSGKDMMKTLVFMVMLLILCLFFLVKDLFIFYLCFELSLIPMFVVIIFWGTNYERLESSYYMLMYTLLISLPLFIYVMLIYKETGSLEFMEIKMSKMKFGMWGLMVMMGAFMIKLPVFMFHIWLPKAHVEAPFYGSMILAAIFLKLGGFGLIKVIFMFYSSVKMVSSFIIGVSLSGSLIISLFCLVQIDLKSLVAYSSVVHMNMVLSLMMSLTKMGVGGSYIIMVSHGLCSSGLFYMVNLYYNFSSSRLMMFNKGMINLDSSLSFWWFLLCCSNFSFPLSVGFIGEIFFSSVILSVDLMMMLMLILVNFFSSAYSLYLFLYIQHGELGQVMIKECEVSSKDFLVLISHYIPLLLMLLNLNIF